MVDAQTKIEAVYPGTFDPITRGHEDIVRRAAKLFTGLRVAVVAGGGGEALFSPQERVDLIRDCLGDLRAVSVEPFDGLLVDYVRGLGAKVIIRGLRAVSDFEYEFQMALMNQQLAPDLDTIYLMPSQKHVYLSSSLVKEVAQYGGDISAQVSSRVKKDLQQRFQDQGS